MAKPKTQATQTETPQITLPTDVRDFEFEGYKFKVDVNLIDDVDAFEIIDRIENKGQFAAIVPLFRFLVGNDGYDKMRAYFVKKDGKFKATTLINIYKLVLGNLGPKD